jgi:hypothetical protein
MKYLKNRYVQLALAFIIGGALSALFYVPKTTETREKIEILETSKIELERELDETRTNLRQTRENLDKTTSEFSSFEQETSQKIESLRVENSKLIQSSKRKRLKLVKPDGTIVEKEYEESQSEEVTSVVTEIRQEFDTKVKSIEDKWKRIHKERVSKIVEDYEKRLKEKKTEVVTKEVIVEREKIVKVNEKKLRTEAGYTSEKKIYTHISYPVWGPFFLGGGASSTTDFKEPEARIGIGLSW